MYTKTFLEAFVEMLPGLIFAGFILWVVASALFHLAKHPDTPNRNWWIVGIILGLPLYGVGVIVAVVYKLYSRKFSLNPSLAKKAFAGVAGFISMLTGYLLVGGFIIISFALIQCARDPKCI